MMLHLLIWLLIQASDTNQALNLREGLGVELEVTTSIVKQHVCLDGSGPDMRADLLLGIKYSNIGKYPVIIHKHSGKLSGWRVYHSQEDMAANRHEVKLSVFPPPPPEAALIDKNSLKNSFKVIKPGESYENEINTRLFLGSGENYDHLSSAEHLIRFSIWTEDGSLPRDKELEVLRRRWLKYGYLYTEGGVSLPMPILFPKAEEVGRCQ